MRAAVLLAIAGLVACTNARLEPSTTDDPPPLDDLLTVTGTICTETPRDELFPVKVMLLVDTSNSLQFTDPATQRVTAVQQLLDRYAHNPAVAFSVIAFDAVISDLTGGFSSNPNVGQIASRLANADRLTDYQGALATAYATLVRDMRDSSPAALARTKYVIVFFSDGTPDPQCRSDQPPAFENVCSVPRDEWQSRFVLPAGTNPNTREAWTWEDFQSLYSELDAGRDYNTEPQLLAKVREIQSLEDVFHVNEIRFHTAFLFDPTLPRAVLDAFGLDRARGLELLTQMAETGNGTFTEFTSGGDITFLNVSYSSAKQAYGLTNLLAVNLSATANAAGREADSDADGLSDRLEDELRTCAYAGGGPPCRSEDGTARDPHDSDGDGYGDFFEHRFRSSGFHPTSPASNAVKCRDSADPDGDGLRNCEETFLGTDGRLVDSDGDRLPDGLELRFGMDPSDRTDARRDLDADGVPDGDELVGHRDPTGKEPPDAVTRSYAYQIDWQGESPEGRNCYAYSIDRIQLMTTRAATAEHRGDNTIRLFFMEGPPDDPRDFGSMRVACVRAKFVAPLLKVPREGTFALDHSGFVAQTSEEADCILAK